MPEIVVSIVQREWQKPLIKAYRDGIKHGLVFAHRRAGKDRSSLFIELEVALRERCTVWHALPEQEQARKVIWDNITRDGQKLMEVAFPRAIRRRTIEDEMKIELLNGSMWQLVGADRIDALMGANPKHVTMSEFALTNPKSRRLIRPVLAENGGSELLITVPRGYNHAHELWQYARTSPLWYAAVHPVSETKLIPLEELEEERRTTPDEIYRQEYECDFSAANLGAVLGKWIEMADREGRLDLPDLYDPEHPVYVASDIGKRDSSSWWFWQPVMGGWFVINNITESGMDAADWAAELKKLPYTYAKIYLPHDARQSTWANKRSGLSVFLEEFGSSVIRVLPAMPSDQKVNAARELIKRCKFATECHDGLMGLRAWTYEYNDETKAYTKEPKHDWASHYGDGFSYFGAIAEEDKPPVRKPGRFKYDKQMGGTFSLDQLWKDREQEGGRMKGI